VEITNGEIKPETQILELVNCTTTLLPYMSTAEFTNRKLSEFECMKDQNFTIFGYSNEAKFASINFRVYLCNPSDTSCDSLRKKEIMRNKSINNYIYFLMLFQNNVFNTANFIHPAVAYSESFGIHYDVEKYKFSQFLIAKSNLITDDGFIWQSEKNETILSIDETSNDFSPLGPSNNYVNVDLKIHPSNKEYTSRRVYNKLPSVLADTLALYEYMKMGIKVFVVFFTDTKKNIKLMNAIF
jgi:hypothetical protein